MSPATIIGAILVFAATLYCGYDWGATAKQNELEAKHAQALVAERKQHNEDSAVDMSAAAEWGAGNARIGQRADKTSAAIAADARANPPPANCVLPNISVGLFNDAIRNANDLSAAADSVRDAVPGVSGTDVGRGTGSQALGNGSDRAGRPVPPPAR